MAAESPSVALMDRLTASQEQQTALRFAFFNTLLFVLVSSSGSKWEGSGQGRNAGAARYSRTSHRETLSEGKHRNRKEMKEEYIGND